MPALDMRGAVAQQSVVRARCVGLGAQGGEELLHGLAEDVEGGRLAFALATVGQQI